MFSLIKPTLLFDPALPFFHVFASCKYLSLEFTPRQLTLPILMPHAHVNPPFLILICWETPSIGYSMESHNNMINCLVSILNLNKNVKYNSFFLLIRLMLYLYSSIRILPCFCITQVTVTWADLPTIQFDQFHMNQSHPYMIDWHVTMDFWNWLQDQDQFIISSFFDLWNRRNCFLKKLNINIWHLIY